MLRAFALASAALIWATGAMAQAQVSVAMDRLGIADMVEIMRVEGVDYAQTLNDEMLDGQGGPLWDTQLAGIYNAGRMIETVRGALATIPDDHLRAINVFYGSDIGRQVISLELAARRAVMDTELETIARDAYAQAVQDNSPQVAQIQLLEQSGDMIERNVTGALTANYQFYLGMVDGNAFAMSEDEIIAEAWAQEDDIRTDTTSWLMGYLLLSYDPLDDDAFDAYLTFAQTPAGRALNSAIFEGFNAMYSDISYALGRAVALNMIGDDL
jgi:hypothetical protein